VRSVPTLPVVGLVAQLGVLAALTSTVGFGGPGAAVGLACAMLTGAALARGLARSDGRGLGPADHVTLTRATLTCGVAALTVDSFTQPARVTTLVAIAVVALLLDAVDGWVARRTGTASALGARLDMEVDAFLVLVLSVYVARVTGWWVLASGAARYAFLAASWMTPWLRGTVPARYWRKLVAATQGVVLTLAAARLLPSTEIRLALLAALGLLVTSFGAEVAELWRGRLDQPTSCDGTAMTSTRAPLRTTVTSMRRPIASSNSTRCSD
jgi:phosphatidylglycerophosphate synthase